MSRLLIKPNRNQALWHNISKESADWRYVGFQVLILKAGEEFSFPALSDTERCFTILAGKADVILTEQSAPIEYRNIGERESVFEDKSPFAVYVPPKLSVNIKALSDNLEIGISSAPAEGKFPCRLIRPEEMKRSVRGKGSNTRYICDILPETDKSAENLLVVEVITPNGNTSSYPPHKHDQATENETYLEETYYHRITPPQGFAFQRVYTDDRSLDEVMAVENHDVVLVPKGYHPCATIHGYDLYYLNTMAGGERRWQFYNAPEHEWLLKI